MEYLPPKIFYGANSSNLFQMVSPRGLVSPLLRVIVPYGVNVILEERRRGVLREKDTILTSYFVMDV